MVDLHHPFLVMLDLMLPETSGLDVLRDIKAVHPNVIVLMMTGFPTVETAVSAMRLGAFDYLQKPLHLDEVLFRVQRVIEHTKLLAENDDLRVKLDHHRRSQRLLGKAKSFARVLDTIDVVATSDANVLISGETGTGKDLVAREIHEKSHRRGKPFVAVDCAALPDHLMVSELFGYEKGAFTGALERHPGLFEAAEGGTAFLDEITEMSTEMQATLLRVLQERQFRRVGGRDMISMNVRIISATNRDPAEAVRQQRFRLDLFYRLNVVPIELPALRERRDDIPLLAGRFLADYARHHDHPAKSISLEALDLLRGHNWPGNVRELENLIQRLSIMTPLQTIEAEDVRKVLSHESKPTVDLTECFGLPFRKARRVWLAQFEKPYLLRLLAEHDGIVSRAAAAAGVDRKTFYRLMRAHGIRPAAEN